MKPTQHTEVSAGRAAGYCWERNPEGPGRCTWPPSHTGRRHKDVYAKTEWQTPVAGAAPIAPATG